MLAIIIVIKILPFLCGNYFIFDSLILFVTDVLNSVFACTSTSHWAHGSLTL